MAAAPGAGSKSQGMAVAGYNYVGQDQIWKDHVTQENITSKQWNNNWSFMTTDYKELVKDEFPPNDRPKVELPPHMQVSPPTPLHERVTVLPSTRPVPKTTNDMIGWRSTDPKLKLEKYGGYAKGRGGLVKQLNWPIEGTI